MKDYYNDESEVDPLPGFRGKMMRIERRQFTDLINFMVWLAAGAMIGWMASQMVSAQHKQRAAKITSLEARLLEDS